MILGTESQYHTRRFWGLGAIVRTSGGQANPAAALDDAYKALGVTKEQSDQEIKRAYRKLMSQYHPDKLIGQGLPEDMIAQATEQCGEPALQPAASVWPAARSLRRSVRQITKP